MNLSNILPQPERLAMSLAHNDSPVPPLSHCPVCGMGSVSPVLSALIDHLLHIEAELTDVKRLLEEVVP
jgi:hypothetical protein